MIRVGSVVVFGRRLAGALVLVRDQSAQAELAKIPDPRPVRT
jgi:hypothetical protein